MSDYLQKINKIEDENHQRILTNIKQTLIQKDEQLFKQITKKKTIVGFGFRLKKIVTPWGIVAIKRHRLLNKNKTKNKFFCPLDQWLGLSGDQRYDQYFVNKIQELIASNQYLSYTQLANSQPHKINKSQVHFLIKNRIQNHQNNQIIYELNEDKPLYINVDDTFLNLKINNQKVKHRIRFFNFHQGKNNKQKIMNLTSFAQIFPCHNNPIPPQQTAQQIKKIISKYYTNKPKKLVFCSDGTREFKHISNHLKAIPNLDKYHLIYRLYFLFKHRKSYTNIPKSVRKKWFKQCLDLAKNKPNLFLSFLDEIEQYIVQLKASNQFKNDLKKTKKYVLNNFSGIKFWQSRYYYSTTTEPFIFHKIKSFLGNKDKIFSLKIFQKLLNFRLNLLF